MWLPRMGTEVTASKTASKKIKLARDTYKREGRTHADTLTFTGVGKGLRYRR